MSYSSSSEFRVLLAQLKHVDDRDVKKDTAHTVNELRRILTNSLTFEELNVDWTEISVPLKTIICHNVMPAETRKAASGALTALGNLSFGFFDRFVDLIADCWKEVPSRKEDRRIYILQALTATLTNIYVMPQSIGVEKLCSTMVSFLDCTNSAAVLTPAMELSLLVSAIAPRHTFLKHYFQDIVDVAIGWLVEEGQEGLTSPKLERTKEILLAFGPFWSEKMELLLNLVKQFLEDIATHVEETKVELDQERLVRIKAIAGTLLLLIKICSQLGTPAASLVVKHASDEVVRLMGDGTMAVYLSSERITAIYAVYINILINCVPFQDDERKMEILNVIVDLAMANLESSNILTALFNYLNVMAEEHRESLSVPLCSLIFGPSSLLSSLHFSRLPPSFLHGAIALFKTLLNPSILSVLQYAYAAVVNMLKDSLRELVDEGGAEGEQAREESITRVTLIIYALKPILKLKNSLIVMLGLSPSLLDLVLVEGRILDERVQETQPLLHHTLLHAAYEHCNSHDNFTATSEWLQGGGGSTVLGESLSSRHFERITTTISSLLTSPALTAKESRVLLVDWIVDMAPSLVLAARSHSASSQMSKLSDALRVAVYLAPETTPRLIRVIKAIEDQLEDYAKITENATLLRLSIERSHTEERAAALWNHLTPDGLLESYSTHEIGEEGPVQTLLSPHQFEVLMNFLLKRVPPTENVNAEKDDQKESWLLPSGAAHSDLTNHWRKRLVAGAAYAIESRMSTHLGKPSQTLNVIHAEMTRLLRQAIPAYNGVKDDDSLAPHEEWFRVRCFVEFVEILDRMMFLAHTGCMIPPYTPSQAARAWFKANEPVCSEWFVRLYPCAMGVAYYCSAYSQVIRFGQSALSEMAKKFSGKAEEATRVTVAVVCWMQRALIEKGDDVMIRGLQEWLRSSYARCSSNWDWLECAILAASARFEKAIDRCEVHLKNATTMAELTDEATTLLQDIILMSLVKLREVPEDLDRAIVNADELERCVQLTSFTRVETVKETKDAVWNLHRKLETSEVWLMSTVRKSEVASLRDRLAVEGPIVMKMDDDGLLTARFSALTLIARDLALKMEKNPQAIENPYSLIRSLTSRAASSNECLSLGRQKAGWAARMGVGEGESRVKGVYALAKLACKLENWCLVDEMKASLGINDVALKLQWGELQCRECSVLGAKVEKPLREELVAREMLPLLTQAYHNYAEIAMNESMGSSSGVSESSSHWANAIARTAFKMARLMGKHERIQPDGMSKLHFLVESRRSGTGLNDAGVLLHLASTLAPSMGKARYQLGMHNLQIMKEEGSEEALKQILFNWDSGGQSTEIMEAITQSASVEELARRIKERVGVEMAVIDRAMPAPGLGQLASLWQQYHSRRGVFLNNAVVELFAFLGNYGSDVCSVRVVTAVLHLLSILTEQTAVHPELALAINDGISTTDERVWAGVIPQLLARISHPLEAVRMAIMNALLRLGRAFPHTTVFPLVVATRAKEVLEEDRFADDPNTTRIFSPSQKEVVHYRMCSALLEDLRSFFPSMVEHTRLFVDEMHHLNLMEEKWCFVLHQLDQEMSKRLGLIRRETERTKAIHRLSDSDKLLLIAAKTDVIIGPIYRIVGDLWRSTQAKAARKGEDALRFVAANAEHVARAIEESEEGRRKGDEHERWEAFVRLNVTLGRKGTKKSGGQLIDVSHCIGRLVEKSGDWRVPLPGQGVDPNTEVVHLVKVDTSCQVLSTKTRPKKMSMKGSDGVDRFFLLKTQEDLRLDERMMQMLQMSNVMMKKMGKRDAPLYATQTYAVTPLGALLGLIQWVNGAVPLYTFYRKWQMRENAKVLAGKKAPDGVSLRPLELFEKKMKELLVENKLDAKLISDRKLWPPELMKTLHEELCAETSKDIISREMWLRALNSAQWSMHVRNFTRSTAVMSMIGALLGLGDRHPDNVLIDFTDFHVIHIDYNVCFDRGRKLRVPETVPFRLTQNIKHAFGISGMEGLFSSSCTAVLTCIRAQQSLFSLLLDPFIYEPLIDWHMKDHLGQTVQHAITHLVYGNDGRKEPKAVTATTLFLIKMRENEGVIEQMTVDAMDFLESLYCRGSVDGSSGGSIVFDPLLKWMEMMDDFLWIIRKEEEQSDFLVEERREMSKCKEIIAWSGVREANGGPTPVQTLIHLIPKMVEKLMALNEECKRRNMAPRLPLGLPPGLEESVGYKEEKNKAALTIVNRVMRKVIGEGCVPEEIFTPKEQATMFIKAAGSRMNNALMYEGWIGWV